MDHLERIQSLEPTRRAQVFKILMDQTRKVETDPGVKEFLAAQYVWAKEEEKRIRNMGPKSGSIILRATKRLR